MKDIIQQKLTELEKTQNDFWNISPEVGSFLNILIKTGNYKNILEIGTSNGYSAIWTALALQVPGGHLVTIEFSKDRQDLAQNNLEECGLLDKVTLLQGSAVGILEYFKPEFYDIQDNSGEAYVDFAFIDASKLEYTKYFYLIHPMLRQGGMIVADNVISHEEKVSGYIETISGHEDYQTVKLNLGTGLLVSLKIK